MKKLKVLFVVRITHYPAICLQPEEFKLREEISEVANPLSKDYDITIEKDLLSERVSKILKEKEFDVMVTHLPYYQKGKGQYKYINEMTARGYGGGIDQIKEIRESYPDLKIVIFSAAPINEEPYDIDRELQELGIQNILRKKVDESKNLKNVKSALEKIAQER